MNCDDEHLLRSLCSHSSWLTARATSSVVKKTKQSVSPCACVLACFPLFVSYNNILNHRKEATEKRKWKARRTKFWSLFFAYPCDTSDTFSSPRSFSLAASLVSTVSPARWDWTQWLLPLAEGVARRFLTVNLPLLIHPLLPLLPSPTEG